MTEFRVERDSMGDVKVPSGAYYSAQTQRAVENFPVSGTPLPPPLLRAMGLVKYACAIANRDLGKLTGSGQNPLSDVQVAALLQAAQEVAQGKMADQFPIDVYQTGSGTSSNMNVNEVIANRAIELTGGDRLAKEKSIHPNDHVNMGQVLRYALTAITCGGKRFAATAGGVGVAPPAFDEQGPRLGSNHQDCRPI